MQQLTLNRNSRMHHTRVLQRYPKKYCVSAKLDLHHSDTQWFGTTALVSINGRDAEKRENPRLLPLIIIHVRILLGCHANGSLPCNVRIDDLIFM